MDFSQFDARSAAEEGAFCQLVNPTTRELLFDGDEPVGFMVRGAASREAQTRLAKARNAGKRKIETANDLHEAEVRTALCYIIEARNIDMDGKPVNSDKTLLRKVLDATFPEIRANDDDEEGGIDLVNRPFARQVNEFASRQDNFLGE